MELFKELELSALKSKWKIIISAGKIRQLTLFKLNTSFNVKLWSANFAWV